jgi:hypothetical protein
MTRSLSYSTNLNQDTSVKTAEALVLRSGVIAITERIGLAECANFAPENQINTSVRNAEYAEGLGVQLCFPNLLNNSLHQVGSFLAALNAKLEELESEYCLAPTRVTFSRLKVTQNSE